MTVSKTFAEAWQYLSPTIDLSPCDLCLSSYASLDTFRFRSAVREAACLTGSVLLKSGLTHERMCYSMC